MSDQSRNANRDATGPRSQFVAVTAASHPCTDERWFRDGLTNLRTGASAHSWSVRSRHWSWIWDSLLALGLLLSFETQLRIDPTSVGPGELCLALWELPIIFLLLFRTDLIVPQACWDLVCFWTLFALALSIGAIIGIVIGDIQDASLVVHDVIAYVLLASMTFLMTLTLPGWRLARVAWLFVIFGSVSLLLQIANTFGLYRLPNIDPWYWDRLRGWCDNPDQLALLCLVIAVLSLHLAEHASRTSARLVAVASIVIAAAFGWMSKSNAYTLVIVLTAVLFGTLKLLRVVVAAEKKAVGSVLLSCALVVLPVALAIPALDDGFVGQLRTHFARGLFRKEVNSEWTIRLYLWDEALHRGADTYLLGLGPGPHLDIPGIILAGRRNPKEPANLQHPTSGIASNFETHNTILELLVQGGVLAVADILGLGIIALSRTLRNKHDGLATALCSLSLFGSSGVIFRLPGVWFIISLALVAHSARRAALGSAYFVEQARTRRPMLGQRQTELLA